MQWITLMMMAVGAGIASIGGMVCYLGQASAATHINWVVGADLYLCHPYLSLAVGMALLVMGLASQPSRIQ